MTIRLLIAYALNLFDLAATTYWVNRFGLEIEGNPIGRWLYETGIAYPVKIVGMAVLFWLLHRAVQYRDEGHAKTFEWWDIASWLVLAVYGLLALYHVILIIRILLI